MGSDARIGSRFLRAGPAYGGSCFPKDTKGLVSIADKFKTNLSIVKSVIKSNQRRKLLLTKRVNKILNNKIKNKKITVLNHMIPRPVRTSACEKGFQACASVEVDKLDRLILSATYI
mgnify:CR=1 FL=1